MRSRALAYTLYAASSLLGAGSLILLLVFVYSGPLRVIELGLGRRDALLVDSALCLAFFVQHSTMVREGFRRRLSRFLGHDYHAAMYSATSGLFLLALIALWQTAGVPLIRVQGAASWAVRGLFALALVGLLWGALALKQFDLLGLRGVRQRLGERPAPQPRFTVRGPYRWVRHPFYFCALLLFWAHPAPTADRLLFNVLFTCWVVFATNLEERDLVATFGERYREYQRRVPMLVPHRRPPRSVPESLQLSD